ncbi:hypothetical protein BOTBODRAFT_444188 [Botryobasidium botryosum FD-172 SS1]|uniref:Uncharacterized protein n=1 Tax=Botryobasidium botryosum (strain FD-172 SS1) TaxID=930990 RepID=A0A067MVG8_BOTB1|nr:hypothetical protein BOTBODRAFT_444188 [Botryobasidium botryosum FD-172 SS1]
MAGYASALCWHLQQHRALSPGNWRSLIIHNRWRKPACGSTYLGQFAQKTRRGSHPQPLHSLQRGSADHEHGEEPLSQRMGHHPLLATMVNAMPTTKTRGTHPLLLNPLAPIERLSLARTPRSERPRYTYHAACGEKHCSCNSRGPAPDHIFPSSRSPCWRVSIAYPLRRTSPGMDCASKATTVYPAHGRPSSHE